MICSKLTRIIHGTTQIQEEIVTGISDYIPAGVKNQQSINILIIGDHKLIINQILWNEFFAKTLIKEAYYFLMHNYLSEGRQTASAVFAKRNGKVYKIEEVMDWKSGLRDVLAKETSEVVCLEIQGFSNKGNIKKINIFISRYATNIDNVHLTLRTNSIEVAKISKNDFQSQFGTEYRNLEETDRVNKPSEHSASQYAQHTHKTKLSMVSNLSLRTKQSKISKENEKPTPSKVAKKSNKKVTKEKTEETAKKSMGSNTQFSSKSFQNTSLLKCQRPSISRETVLSKIITSKEQQILILKQELQYKTDEYTVLIRDQQEAHEKQVEALTKKVKEVLQSYSQSQKEAANENVYLKERVKILQETIEKTNSKMETYNVQMQGYVKNVRELQDMNKRLTETNKQLSQEQERSRNIYLSESTRMNSEITSWRDKAEQYRHKYEKIVEMMKGVIGYS